MVLPGRVSKYGKVSCNTGDCNLSMVPPLPANYTSVVMFNAWRQTATLYTSLVPQNEE